MSHDPDPDIDEGAAYSPGGYFQARPPRVGEGSGQAQYDPDYLRWRTQQIRELDKDYERWREDHPEKFSDEFTTWRREQHATETEPEGGKNQ